MLFTIDAPRGVNEEIREALEAVDEAKQKASR